LLLEVERAGDELAQIAARLANQLARLGLASQTPQVRRLLGAIADLLDHPDEQQRRSVGMAALLLLATTHGALSPPSIAAVVEPVASTDGYWLLLDLAHQVQRTAENARVEWLDFTLEVQRLTQ